MKMFVLMCSERSGSNLITKLMDAHSSICGPATKHIINPVARNLFRYEPLELANNWDSLLIDIHGLLAARFSAWRREYSLDELKGLAQAGDIAGLIRRIFAGEVVANGKQHVFIKENHVYEFQPFMLINYPEARYVYQTRDPRDMALSWKKSPNHPGGIVRAARQWEYDQKNTLKNYNELRKKGLACHIRYEDLIADTNRYTTELMAFFGLPDEPCHDSFFNNELTRKNAELHEGWSNLSGGVLTGNAGKYRKELTEDEIRIIEKICSLEMKHFGYLPDHTDEQLAGISDTLIDKHDAHEMESIPCVRSAGVRENMAAKKRFYRRTG